MARPSKLTPHQIESIKDEKMRGATLVQLAEKYKVGFATISRIVSERVSEMKNVAETIAKAKEPLKDFNVMERVSITRYADDLLTISDNLADASKIGSATSARLQGIAERQSRKIETRLDIDGKETIVIDGDALKMTMAVTQVANEAAKTSLNLLAANKEQIKEFNDENKPPLSPYLVDIPSDPVESSKVYQRMVKGN